MEFKHRLTDNIFQIVKGKIPGVWMEIYVVGTII